MMQGQEGISNALAGTFSFDSGSNDINLQRDQNDLVPADVFVHNGHPVISWMGQSSYRTNSQTPFHYQDLVAEDGMLSNQIDQSTSSVNAQTPVRFQDLLTEDGLLSSSIAGVVIDQRSVERHLEPTVAFFHPSANMSLGNGHPSNRALSLQQASSSAHPQNIDLNAACDSRGTGAYLNTRTGLCINPFKSGRPVTDQNLLAVNSSNSDPLVISSGIAGYVVEENESGEGNSSYGRRLSCKRRAPEDSSRRLSLGESSISIQTGVVTKENVSRGLNLSTPMNSYPNVQYSEQLDTEPVVGLGTVPVMHQPSSDERGGLRADARASNNVHQLLRTAGGVENSQRNIRMRRTVNHQDFAPANLDMRITRNSHAQLPGQPAVFFPFDCVPNTSSATGIVPSTPSSQSVHDLNSLEALQPFQWNAVTRSSTGMLSTAHALNGGDALLLEHNPRYNASNGTFPSEILRRNLEHMLTNPNFVTRSNSPGNFASSSRNSLTRCTHPSLAPIWLPQGDMAHQYTQRISNIVNCAESQEQSRYCAHQLCVSLAARERELSTRGSNARPYRIPLRSGLIARAERQNGAHPEVTSRSLTAAQRRSRLVSEVRNALALVRRGGSLQFEDVMVIDRSVLYGVPAEPDLHEDMRLDVDNMSYEELLALEDQIGNVCTGLSEDVIQSRMKQQKYQTVEVGTPKEDEPCCICQEEYADGQDFGKLDCGHDFHFNCIKQWLVLKNSCPICKMTALKV